MSRVSSHSAEGFHAYPQRAFSVCVVLHRCLLARLELRQKRHSVSAKVVSDLNLSTSKLVSGSALGFFWRGILCSLLFHVKNA